MPQFIDRTETVQVDLGPCECEDTSRHTTDTIWILKRISFPDQMYLADASSQGYVEALWALFNLRVVRWNLIDAKGKPIPLSRAIWQNLDEAFAKKIQDAIGSVQAGDDETVPNDSSAPSADS